ncbi:MULTISPECIES: hypothetical protein [Massilia]|uniref:hypothetical protein n=1 Tax=Massilia TaxID=149698 RepID=UPI0011CEAFDE|nr:MULTISPECIES: hypothetical protein [Massilia]MDY0964404.1 hypothetical protein [Massilia sp. CFBP9026]
MVQWKLPSRNFIITEKQQTHTAEFVRIKLHLISFIALTRRWSNTLWQPVNQFYYRLLRLSQFGAFASIQGKSDHPMANRELGDNSSLASNLAAQQYVTANTLP